MLARIKSTFLRTTDRYYEYIIAHIRRYIQRVPKIFRQSLRIPHIKAKKNIHINT